jgi:hypothetical protein
LGHAAPDPRRRSHAAPGIFLYIFLLWFSKNKWSTQNFREVYIWRQTPRQQEFLPPWGTVLGVAPTVGCPARWSQIPVVVGHDGRNPSTIAHGGRVLAPWATAATSPLYKGAIVAAAGPPPSLTPLNLRL